MPIEHLVERERRLLEVIFLGAVSREEIEAFQYRVFRSLGEVCGWLGLDRAGLCLEETAHG